MPWPFSALARLLTDPTTAVTLSTAVCTAGYSALRANAALLTSSTGSGAHGSRETDHAQAFIDENTRMLEGGVAMLFPLAAAASLLGLFFFLGSVGMVLTAVSAVTGGASVLFVMCPVAEFFTRWMRTAGVALRANGVAEAILLAPIVVWIIGVWLYTGHWAPNNAIGVSLCILFGSLCRVPSLKVTSMLFAGLFVYDIFFVFFSERFFGRNVMVEVATSTPTNPASALASLLHLPVTPVSNLALPAKLVFPAGDGRYAILGLGDIILPVVLLVYLLEFDLLARTAPLRSGLFVCAMFCYAAGLLVSFFCSFAFHVAQPALLYIVPAMIIPTLLIARKRGCAFLLWNGPATREPSQNLSQEEHTRAGETLDLLPPKNSQP